MRTSIHGSDRRIRLLRTTRLEVSVVLVLAQACQDSLPRVRRVADKAVVRARKQRNWEFKGLVSEVEDREGVGREGQY